MKRQPTSFLVDTSKDGPTFKDFGGYPEVIERAKELIETQFLRRDLLQTIGARPVKGILFTGAAGNRQDSSGPHSGLRVGGGLLPSQRTINRQQMGWGF